MRFKCSVLNLSMSHSQTFTPQGGFVLFKERNLEEKGLLPLFLHLGVKEEVTVRGPHINIQPLSLMKWKVHHVVGERGFWVDTSDLPSRPMAYAHLS